MNRFKYFLRDENGATAIEYGLIAALISVVLFTAMKRIGSNYNNTFVTVGTKLR